MARPLRRIAILFLAIVFVFLVVPPLYWAIGELWLLARASERERAVRIISETISAGTSRAFDVEYRVTHPAKPAGNMGVIAVQRHPDPIRDIPTCAHAAYLSRPMYRHMAIEEARFLSFAEDISNLRLVALSACTNTTPFAYRCGRSYLRAALPTTDRLIPHLSRLGVVRVDNGRACWLLPLDPADG